MCEKEVDRRNYCENWRKNNEKMVKIMKFENPKK